VAAVWDERTSGTLKTRMRVKPPGGTWEPAVTLGDEAAGANAVPAFYPAIGATADAWIVAWTSGTQPRTAVVVQRVSFRQGTR
jgi:hypothetical protein